MSDYLPDTPVLSRRYCPTCEPDADPTKEILDVDYCCHHQIDRSGRDDDAVITSSYMSGSAEAGGDDNRAVCDLLHRNVEPPPKPKKEPEAPCNPDACYTE